MVIFQKAKNIFNRLYIWCVEDNYNQKIKRHNKKIIIRKFAFINLFCYNVHPSFTKYNILSHYLKYYIKLFQKEGEVLK